MSEITVGLVGYGLGGSTFHAPLICSVRELRLAAVVTSRREQVERDLPGVAVVSTVAELVADPGIELIVVSSPSPSHYEVAHAALLAGKNVVVDKPFTLSVRDAEALMALAENKGRMLSVFQNRRWDNDFLTVRHCMDEKLLGTVYHYEAHFDRFRPEVRPVWREQSGKGSGILYDLGAHLIDQALQLFGMPQAIFADVLQQRRCAETDDYFHLVLDYGQKRAILHGSTLVRQPGPHFAVHGDAGSFLKNGMDPQEEALKAGMRPGDPQWGLDEPANYGELVCADGARRKVETLRGGYERYYEAIAARLLRNEPIPVDPADSRDGLLVVEAALRSSLERRSIALV
jgi:scyllo-inositol 2-dehydrogenase (NADP+)